MRSGFANLAAGALAAFSLSFAHADDGWGGEGMYRVGPADIPCVIQAALRQGVPANVLLALASMEGGKNGQLMHNANGTDDLGHFQINTIHFSQRGVFSRVSLSDAAWRGCYNAELAAWILRQRLNVPSQADYWTRVAMYHSATPKYNAIYRAKVIPLAARWGRWLQANYNTSVSYN